MTEWLAAIVAALALFALAAAAVGLVAYIRLVDPFRVDVASWIGDLTQGVIVLVATLVFLALALVSEEPYVYVAAAACAGVEAIGVWLLWLVSCSREASGRASGFVIPPPLARAEASRRWAAPRWTR